MVNFIKQMVNDKKEYKEMVKRGEQLPEEYSAVYKKITAIMWSQATGTGMEMLRLQYDLLEMFETAVNDGKSVWEITGRDLNAFTADLIQDTRTWVNDMRKKLNRKISNRVGRGNGGNIE